MSSTYTNTLLLSSLFCREIVGHVIEELNKTKVNQAMHGKVFEGFWKTIETMLPGSD